MDRRWRIASISAGICLTLLTTGWSNSRTTDSQVKMPPIATSLFYRFARRVSGMKMFMRDHQKGSDVVNLFAWKRLHPWRTLHFAIATTHVLDQVMRFHELPGSQVTVAVTSQVKSERRKRPTDLSRFSAHQSEASRNHQATRSTTAQPAMGLKIAAIAMTMLGRPYVWGGAKLSTGFDCSGLVQYVLRSVGIAAPRTTWQQYTFGKNISSRALQPGDLLFFTTYASGPTHVGIYVGNRRFVNSLNPSTGVVLSSLDEKYFAERFIGARNPWAKSVTPDKP